VVSREFWGLLGDYYGVLGVTKWFLGCLGVGYGVWMVTRVFLVVLACCRCFYTGSVIIHTASAVKTALV